MTLLNSSGVMPFLTLTAVFLFIGPVLFIGIVTMWSNLKQKISDELSARVTRIVDTKNNTPEIEKTFIEMNKKLSAHISEVNVNSTAEISKIKNEIYSQLTAEINKIKHKTICVKR